MKRSLRPFYLASLCWLLVFLFPATRNGLRRDRKAAFPASAFETGATFQREAKRRFPNDRRVQLDALSSTLRDQTPAIAEAAARKWKDDATALTLILRSQLGKLKNNRNDGVLSNPNGPGAAPPKAMVPASPRADYDRFIAISRRGQQLEPNNTFFDWMILYALFATHRDDEARAALKLAVRKTGYDDHTRDIVLNRLAVSRLLYGAPLTPLENISAWAITLYPEFGKMRQTARWIMEDVIADRQAGRHPRALDTAFDLTQLGRVMRRENYSLIGSLVASAIENIAILRTIASPPLSSRTPRTALPRLGAPLSSLQSSAVSLHAYAKSQNRLDITKFLDREWVEIGQWRRLNAVIIGQNWMGNPDSYTLTLTAAARFRALILRALPSILLLGALSTLLSRRFRDDSGAPISGFWRGAVAGGILLTLLLAFDAMIVYGQTSSGADLSLAYFEGGLIALTPSWATFGAAGATTLLSLNAAVAWQKRQMGPKTSLQSLFDAPADGLMRFDFGWLFGLVARFTGWILLLGTFITTSFNFAQGGYAHDNPSLYGAVLLGVTLLLCLALNYGAWSRKPRRRQTLRLSWRLISQSLLGFFVASSVLYALASFAILPLAFRYERNFQSAMERGEVQIARSKLGL